ncbi:transposase, partial [Methylobacterium sp. CCH7-A2]|uniref:transposase n=1 Tax=Methylobacterium sp. CCH7-A2 TaxID=1768789 RepID=UPI000B0E3847
EGLAGEEAADPAKRADRVKKRRANRGSLPAHLPRIEQVADIQDMACPCCRGQSKGPDLLQPAPLQGQEP